MRRPVFETESVDASKATAKPVAEQPSGENHQWFGAQVYSVKRG
jgi:hypothetical protein